MTYGTARINNEYTGNIVMIKNPKITGKYIPAILYPTCNCHPAEYPELSWDKLVIEIFECPCDLEVKSIFVDYIKWEEDVNWDGDQDLIKEPYYADTENCLVIECS